MDIRDAGHLTLASIRTHKLRSVLAAIGVVLGIGSVIGVVTMGAGFQESITSSFTSEFEADLISVSLAANGTTPAGPPSFTPVLAFTDRDVGAIGALDGVKESAATRTLPGVQVFHDGEALPGIQVSATLGHLQFIPLEAGRAREGPDDATVSNLTALHLMEVLGRSDVLGTRLEIVHLTAEGGYEHANVTVVGIESASSFRTDEAMTVDARFAPADASGTRGWTSLGVRADDADGVEAVKERVERYLADASDARERKGDRLVFRFDTQSDVIALITSTVNQFTAFIGALGGVALLVGLVGIANIMLVSVQERTREIGVMKATGASRGDVMLVFLVESVAICVVGALLGIGIGMLMGLGLNSLIGAFSGGEANVPFVLVPGWYTTAVVLGIFVGLVAGLYPAWRAAKVSPVEALRYE